MPYLASNSRYSSMPYNRTGNSGLKLHLKQEIASLQRTLRAMTGW